MQEWAASGPDPPLHCCANTSLTTSTRPGKHRVASHGPGHARGAVCEQDILQHSHGEESTTASLHQSGAHTNVPAHFTDWGEHRGLRGLLSPLCKLCPEHPRAANRSNDSVRFHSLPSRVAEGLNREKRWGHRLYSVLPKASPGRESTAVLLKKITESEKLQQNNEGKQLLFQTQTLQMSRLCALASCASQWKLLQGRLAGPVGIKLSTATRSCAPSACKPVLGFKASATHGLTTQSSFVHKSWVKN